jgi:hypothetical protein
VAINLIDGDDGDARAKLAIPHDANGEEKNASKRIGI